MSFIETYTGRAIDPFHPDPTQIHPDDIFHALTQINRFGGHTRTPYTVAEHSLLVMGILNVQGHDETVQLQGLMHDAAEAYMGDVPTPIKMAWPGFVDAEDRLLSVIFGTMNIPWWTDEQRQAVHEADQMALHVEAKVLMPLKVWKVPEVDFELIFRAHMTKGTFGMRHWYERLLTVSVVR